MQNAFQVFYKIAVPNGKMGIAAVVILTFIDSWNVVEQPLVFLKDPSMYPLSVFFIEDQSFVHAYRLCLWGSCHAPGNAASVIHERSACAEGLNMPALNRSKVITYRGIMELPKWRIK